MSRFIDHPSFPAVLNPMVDQYLMPSKAQMKTMFTKVVTHITWLYYATHMYDIDHRNLSCISIKRHRLRPFHVTTTTGDGVNDVTNTVEYKV